MYSRREIRETSIQFLYCSDIEGGANAGTLLDAFWDLTQESDQVALTKAKVKALQHLNKGRETRFAQLIDRQDAATAHLSAEPEAKALSQSQQTIIRLESQWQAKLDRVRRLFDPEDQEISSELEQELADFFALNQGLIQERIQYHHHLSDYPYLLEKLAPFTATVRSLDRISERVSMVEKPSKFPEKSEVSHLRNAEGKLTAFREEVNSLTKNILQKKNTIDKVIAETVTNYKPERINPIDRAILRLATYEIMFDQSIPPAVSMNEAIELARRYGTQDSSKFVNGLLHSVHKAHATD